MKFKRLCLVLSLFCVGSIALPSEARAGSWLEFFFPSMQKRGPDPAETLKAPFADPDAVIDDTVADETPENSLPLDMSHRSDAIIAAWAQQNVSELLSYNADTYQKEYKRKSLLLDKHGNSEYVKFLQSKNILKTLGTGKYDVRCFVEDVPLLMNEGPVTGRYRWLFQVKVMLSYVPKGITDYKVTKEDDSITQEMVVNLQVGRVAGVKNEHGILIESWDGKVVRKGGAAP
ncbi:MAG: DotI/IcmL family type IV secretion protein [Alphaproteobacteria bacterium]|nr:DotI/IcmL family type IV secretion protein [Alphaproteobacteria bacterium]